MSAKNEISYQDREMFAKKCDGKNSECLMTALNSACAMLRVLSFSELVPSPDKGGV